MSDTLYLQLDQNIEVTNPHVYLQDIAALSMSDPKILNRLRVMPVIVLDAKKPGRYVMSVSDLLKKIQKLEPSIDISPIGRNGFYHHLPHQLCHRENFPVCKNPFCMPGFLFRRRFFHYDL